MSAAQSCVLAKPSEIQTSLTCEIRKVDDKKRIVAGFIAVTEDDGVTPIVDHEGDQIDVDVLETAVSKAFGGAGIAAGFQHEILAGQVVQALTVDSKEREAFGFGSGPSGLAFKMQIQNEAVWKGVESGAFREFSIHGTATRVPA